MKGGGIHLPPGLGKISPVGQSVIKQDRQLLCLQRMERCAHRLGPPAKFALREAAEAKPKPVAIVNEQFERRAGAIAENEERAGKRIFIQPRLAKGGERINPLAEVHWLAGE